MPGTIYNSTQCGQIDLGECSYGAETRTCDESRLGKDRVCEGDSENKEDSRLASSGETEDR